VFGSGLLREIFGPMRDDVTGYCSSII
jgi:hypothetical protein